MHRITAFCLTLLSFLTLTLSAEKSLPSNYPIVTTCTMVTDLVENVVGDKAKVIGLMKEGVDPHLYKPTRDDLVSLSKADVVFYSGLMLEGRMADSFARMGRNGVPCYAVTELLDEEYLLEPDDFDGHWDPHVWNDVKAWMSAANAVADALSELDPTNAETYNTNLEAYLLKLNALDQYAKKSIATIPEKSRVLITAHDAFNYFSRAYGISVKAAQGVTTESEAAISDIQTLVDFVVANKINAIFVENIASDRNLQAILEGAKKKGHICEIGGELYSDATGKAGTYEGTYEGMIDHNVTLITRKLGGKAPEKGLNGLLSTAH